MRPEGICPCCGEVVPENLQETIACSACARWPRLVVRFLRDRIRLTKAIAPVLLAALVTLACAAHAPKKPIAPLPFKVDPFDNTPRPWCKNVVLPQLDETCWVCADDKTSREQIGRGSGEGCLHPVLGTWGPAPTPTATPTPSGGDR